MYHRDVGKEVFETKRAAFFAGGITYLRSQKKFCLLSSVQDTVESTQYVTRGKFFYCNSEYPETVFVLITYTQKKLSTTHLVCVGVLAPPEQISDICRKCAARFFMAMEEEGRRGEARGGEGREGKRCRIIAGGRQEILCGMV